MYIFITKYILISIIKKRMRNKKKLLIEQLDQKLTKFKDAGMVQTPQKGWVNIIRTTLNMTREQLGAKLNLTKGAIQKIEEREATGQITLHKLRDVGNALDMRFVYGFIPRDESIDNLISIKAESLARKIVLRTNQNMKLEDQGISDKKINSSITDLANEIKREMRKSLWD
jgi:predicted DNA-binding mobile mystery protein A